MRSEVKERVARTLFSVQQAQFAIDAGDDSETAERIYADSLSDDMSDPDYNDIWEMADAAVQAYVAAILPELEAAVDDYTDTVIAWVEQDDVTKEDVDAARARIVAVVKGEG